MKIYIMAVALVAIGALTGSIATYKAYEPSMIAGNTINDVLKEKLDNAVNDKSKKATDEYLYWQHVAQNIAKAYSEKMTLKQEES